MIQTLLVRHSAMASRITQNTVFVALTVSSLATPSAATLSEPLPPSLRLVVGCRPQWPALAGIYFLQQEMARWKDVKLIS